MSDDFGVCVFDGHVDGVESAMISGVDFSAFGNQKSNDSLVSARGRSHQRVIHATLDGGRR